MCARRGHGEGRATRCMRQLTHDSGPPDQASLGRRFPPPPPLPWTPPPRHPPSLRNPQGRGALWSGVIYVAYGHHPGPRGETASYHGPRYSGRAVLRLAWSGGPASWGWAHCYGHGRAWRCVAYQCGRACGALDRLRALTGGPPQRRGERPCRSRHEAPKMGKRHRTGVASRGLLDGPAAAPVARPPGRKPRAARAVEGAAMWRNFSL